MSPSATSGEVADQVAERFGADFGPPARFVGDAADQALYSTVWPLEEARARTAWDSQRQLYKAMRHTVGFEAAAQTLLRVGTAPARPSQQGPRPQVREGSGNGHRERRSGTVIRAAVTRVAANDADGQWRRDEAGRDQSGGYLEGASCRVGSPGPIGDRRH